MMKFVLETRNFVFERMNSAGEIDTRAGYSRWLARIKLRRKIKEHVQQTVEGLIVFLETAENDDAAAVRAAVGSLICQVVANVADRARTAWVRRFDHNYDKEMWYNHLTQETQEQRPADSLAVVAAAPTGAAVAQFNTGGALEVAKPPVSYMEQLQLCLRNRGSAVPGRKQAANTRMRLPAAQRAVQQRTLQVETLMFLLKMFGFCTENVRCCIENVGFCRAGRRPPQTRSKT